MHVPQSLLTRSELVHMMMVPKNIITPQASRPCMGPPFPQNLLSFQNFRSRNLYHHFPSGFPPVFIHTGIVQDTLLGCNRLTKRDTFLDQSLMMNVLMHVPSFERVPVPAIVKSPSGPLWTGACGLRSRQPRNFSGILLINCFRVILALYLAQFIHTNCAGILCYFVKSILRNTVPSVLIFICTCPQAGFRYP